MCGVVALAEVFESGLRIGLGVLPVILSTQECDCLFTAKV